MSDSPAVIKRGDVLKMTGRGGSLFSKRKKSCVLSLTKEALYFQRIESKGRSSHRKRCHDDARVKALKEKQGSASEKDFSQLNDTVVDLRVVQSVTQQGKSFIICTCSAKYTCDVSNDAEASSWCSAIMDAVKSLPAPPPSKLTQLFASVDSSKDGKVEFDEILKLIKRLGIHVRNEDVARMFEVVDKDHNGALDFAEFVQLYEDLLAIPEVHSLFGSIVVENSKDKDLQMDKMYLDEHSLKYFLRNMQQSGGKEDEEVTPEFTRAVLHSFRSNVLGTPVGCMDAASFTEFLTSPVANGIVDPVKLARPQDMTRPIAEYFIASSHNTYLEGHQLRGVSSAAAYEAAFAKTCRCVEIDLWDGPTGEPIVYHGHTLVSKATAREVIAIIAKTAFAGDNTTPVILSLENHCCTAQQEVFAKILKEELGDMLAEPFPSNYEPMPSPVALARKVLLKGKITSDAAKVAEGEEQPLTPRSPRGPKNVLSDVACTAGEASQNGGKKKKEEKLCEMLTEMTHLGTFRCAAKEANAVARSEVNENGDPVALSGGKPSRMMFSLSEHKVLSLMGSGSCSSDAGFSNSRAVGLAANRVAVHMLQRYNSIHVTRTYPKGTRVGSSNYNPLPGWHTGCQLVALNYQTSGLSMWLNKALFSLNGGCGYVLKPSWLIKAQDPPASESVKVTFRIISAGRLLPENSSRTVNPSVSLNIFGYLGNCEQFHTSTANAWNPVWGESSTHTIVAPEITLVQFAVHDSKSNPDGTLADDLLAQYTFPFAAVRPGYRSVPLYDPQTGDQLPDAFILVQMTIEPAAASAAAPAAEAPRQ